MTHNMKLRKEPYGFIASGKKSIEMRLYDEKRQLINVGDLIVFTNIETGETVTTKVLALHRYPSFKELYEVWDKTKIGYNEEDEAHYTDMESYYPQEEIEKYGVVGIEIELV